MMARVKRARRWRGTLLVDPRDLPDDWLADFAQHGHPSAPEEWLAETFAVWCDRGRPGEETCS